MLDGLGAFAYGAICFLLGVMITMVIALVFATPDKVWQEEALERGYALHCPDDGEFSWEGECDDE